MTDKMIELIAKRFRMLGEPLRLRILQELELGEKAVGELVTDVGGNQPNISKHLQLLHEGGLVNRRREGTSIFYAISDPMVIQLCELICRSATQRSKREFEELSGRSITARKK